MLWASVGGAYAPPMLTCTKCGNDNPEGSRFCNGCGTGLEIGSALATEARKFVSVLFCDLVGSTTLGEDMDPEDIRAVIHPYFEVLRKEIESYGGTVEKFIGDAVMAVFGAPTSHEDDPERAVRAGLRILDAIQELNNDHGTDLAVRIGINTGEVVVALGARPELGEGIVTGRRREHRRSPSNRSARRRHRGRRDDLSVHEERVRLRVARGGRGQGEDRARRSVASDSRLAHGSGQMSHVVTMSPSLGVRPSGRNSRACWSARSRIALAGSSRSWANRVSARAG